MIISFHLIQWQDPGCYCPGMLALKFNWLIKAVNLGPHVVSCKARHPASSRGSITDAFRMTEGFVFSYE